ncbi:hypothetical protein [Bacillus kwashiorkori]|uniref:hypothetical protein n=1 Tax=Bacillus kwashiorkori TaxID=1522318 RepID=UPI000783EE2B|nr:hypothetical protein [Bacillus kwashiorkori]
MDYRTFKLNNELCIIHYPKKPNGFGILVIGNDYDYVDEKQTSWTKNKTRYQILQKFLQAGYTVFYSNLGGKHYGNEFAVELTMDLYEYVKRVEILNNKIHLFAEDEGAIIANKFINEKREVVRSVLFLNPIFTLSILFEELADQPFSYRKFLKEVGSAYNQNEEECEKFTKNHFINFQPLALPYKIIHILKYGLNDRSRIHYYKMIGKDIPLHVILPEKQMDIATQAIYFFQKYEVPL